MNMKANRAFLFNPQNDGALALNQEVYTPDRQAALLARKYAHLMWWLGDENDIVLLPSDGSESSEGSGPRLVVSLKGWEIKEFCPWGWSRNAARLLRDAGAESVPSPDFDSLRILSHRRTSITIYHALQQASLPCSIFTKAPMEITDLSQIPVGDVWVKAPWSSSGRGVRHIADGNLAGLEGIIRRQGSLLVERAYDKVEDFAMLFRSRQGKVGFEGYSLFDCARGSAYAGNLLLTDLEIEQRLAQYVSLQDLRRLRDALEDCLTAIVGPLYTGPLGVDMMIARTPTRGYAIVPCVELNLRYTMGFIAHAQALRGLRGRLSLRL